MSVYSTLSISRDAALKAFHALKSTEPSNEELKNILDAILEPALYNCMIVGDYENSNNCDDMTIIRLAEDFKEKSEKDSHDN